MSNRLSGALMIIFAMVVTAPHTLKGVPIPMPNDARSAGEFAAVVVAILLLINGLFRVYKGGRPAE